MTAEEGTAWSRKHGVFVHNLDQWKKDAISAMKPKSNKEQIEKEKNLKKEISALKKDLTPKDKALIRTCPKCSKGRLVRFYKLLPEYVDYILLAPPKNINLSTRRPFTTIENRYFIPDHVSYNTH